MRLLIAEDELDLAEALTVFFEKNHFSVDAVHNGFDAYEYASTGEYDAVILDVMMPKLDGIQVLERLRQEGVKTPIMMLTAKGEKNDRITGFNAGADDYLPKPFDPDELLSRVRAILRRSEAYQPTVLAYGDLTLDILNTAALAAGLAKDDDTYKTLQDYLKTYNYEISTVVTDCLAGKKTVEQVFITDGGVIS